MTEALCTPYLDPDATLGRAPRAPVPDSAVGGEREIAFDRALIATGASPAIPVVPGLAGIPYWSSTEALAADEIPEHLLVYGGSAVALELAQAFLRLGSRVTLIARSTLLSREDPLIGSTLAHIHADEGLRIIAGTTVRRVAYDGRAFVLDLGGETVAGDRLLAGRSHTKVVVPRP